MWWCSGERGMLACQRFHVPFWVLTYNFHFFLVEKNLMTVKKFLSVAKMAPTVYETETCCANTM